MHRCFKQLAPEAGEAEGGDTHSRAPEGGTLTYQAERQRDTHLPQAECHETANAIHCLLTLILISTTVCAIHYLLR